MHEIHNKSHYKNTNIIHIRYLLYMGNQQEGSAKGDVIYQLPRAGSPPSQETK